MPKSPPPQRQHPPDHQSAPGSEAAVRGQSEGVQRAVSGDGGITQRVWGSKWDESRKKRCTVGDCIVEYFLWEAVGQPLI